VNQNRPECPQTRRRLIAAIAGSVVVLDAVTKAIASRALAGKGIVDVLGGAFHLELYRNFAGPGNILTGHPLLVSVLSLLAVALLARYAWVVRTTSYAVAIALLLGGGVGNLLDRLLRAPGPLRGGVIDWIKPTLSSGSLNIADLSINAGVLAMLIALTLDSYRRPRAIPGNESRHS
jgi:signal peptidase II